MVGKMFRKLRRKIYSGGKTVLISGGKQDLNGNNSADPTGPSGDKFYQLFGHIYLCKNNITMKKLLLLSFILISMNSYSQMISVTGGNLNLHGNNYGYMEVELMQDITKNFATHVSYTKTLGGKDIMMVGGKLSTTNQRFGALLSACYMISHKTMMMWGVDVKPLKKSPISLVYSQSTDNELKTFGLKIPVFHKKHH